MPLMFSRTFPPIRECVSINRGTGRIHELNIDERTRTDGRSETGS